MKEQLDVIKRCNAAIAEHEARIAKINGEAEKHALARDAAVHTASDLRTRAGHLRALALIGEADDKEADRHDQDAKAAEKRAEKVHAMIASFDEQRKVSQDAIAAARAERSTAIGAAIDTYAESALIEYEAAAAAFVKTRLRVRALESIKAARGGRARNLFLSRECNIPATVRSTTRAGAFNDTLYDADWERRPGGYEPLVFATDEEIDALARIGLEV